MQFRKNVEGRYGKQNAREKAQGITLLYAVFIKPKKTWWFFLSQNACWINILFHSVMPELKNYRYRSGWGPLFTIDFTPEGSFLGSSLQRMAWGVSWLLHWSKAQTKKREARGHDTDWLLELRFRNKGNKKQPVEKGEICKHLSPMHTWTLPIHSCSNFLLQSMRRRKAILIPPTGHWRVEIGLATKS